MFSSTMAIHATAIIHPTAVIGENVTIGPFSIVEEGVKIGDGCKVGSHVLIGSHTQLGKNNQIFQGAIVGAIPQDKSCKNGGDCLIIGDNNTIREYVTISKGTHKSDGVTRVGDGNLLMNYVHIGHDAILGSHIVIANSVQIAGHVEIEDYVFIGGQVCILQFCKIGKLSMIGGASGVSQDIVPYSLANGERANICGVNIVGLRKEGISRDEMKIIKDIHSILFRQKLSLAKSIEVIGALPSSECKQHTLDFLNKSTRGIARMNNKGYSSY